MDWKNSQYFKKILKFCGLNIRCVSEIRKKISSFGINEETKQEILDFLIEKKFVYKDEIYLEKYLENIQLNLNSPNFYKLYTKDKILFKLLKKGITRALILKFLDKFLKDTQEIMILKYLQKVKKKLATKTFQQKISYLTSRGFEYSKVIKIVKDSEKNF